jgi:4a-hydroxytetrahydrobiopterin dehydratase
MLHTKHCTIATANQPVMPPHEVKEKLAQISGWNLSEGGKAIARQYSFKNYADALIFVRKISAIAETENHHPDVSFGWGYATLTFTTHNIGGLHLNDFIMAAKCNEVS